MDVGFETNKCLYVLLLVFAMSVVAFLIIILMGTGIL
jgi:hypothetical protein